MVVSQILLITAFELRVDFPKKDYLIFLETFLM